jgi:hypothetical protein
MFLRSRPRVLDARARRCSPRGSTPLVFSLLSVISAIAHAESSLPPEVGWDSGMLETGRSAALGGADRAVSSSVGAMLSNPANMVANRAYDIGAFASIWPEAKRQSYGAAVVDSSTSSTSLAGGLAAAWTIQDPDGIDRRGSDLRLALAYPFSPMFRLGISGRYLAFRQDGEGPLGPSLASGGLDGEVIARGFGVDAGVTLQPNKLFSLSLVGTNLNSPGNGFQPTMVGGGVAVGQTEFTVEADAVADFTTWDRTATRGMLGGELLVADKFPLRAGYRYDGGPRWHWLSAGAGYVDQSMSLEFGVRRTINGEGATAIVFTFTYHVESSGAGSSGDMY